LAGSFQNGKLKIVPQRRGKKIVQRKNHYTDSFL
jgi:predicted SpoU family rRNA methylase